MVHRYILYRLAERTSVTQRKWNMGTEAIAAQRRPRRLRVFLTAMVVALAASVPLVGSKPAAAEMVALPASVPLLGANPASGPLLGAKIAVAATPPHIMVIVEENEGYSNIIGSSKAPYINSLAMTHASATKWYGLTDSSLGDYVALISGTTGTYSSPTLVGELATAGISWKAYMEGAPSACYTGGGVANYTKVHNPFVHFKSITGNAAQCGRIVPFAGSGGFASDLTGNTAPSFMFVVPNNCDDMHSTCSTVNKIKQGDNWLQANLPTVLNSSWYTAGGGIVIITWDSATTSDTSGWKTGSGGHIPTIVISANSSVAFTFNLGGNHYGTLRAIEDAYGVGRLGNSSNLAYGDLTPAF
jgi:phosphatidylinositol-3-phosphatase